MNNIRIICLTQDDEVRRAERLMCTAARLTQNGHKWSQDDFTKDFDKEVNAKMVQNLCKLPHPTLQKFGVITFVIFGASRRFLAQITRHQVDVKFMSASLQYSDYSGSAEFCVPYEVLTTGNEKEYLEICQAEMAQYESFCMKGIDHDDAGYVAPQGLRNILIMSANIFEWKHIIAQRTCRRNTKETRYVMLRIWEYLYNKFPELFGLDTTGPWCMQDICREGRMSCCDPMYSIDSPEEIIIRDFPLLVNAPRCEQVIDYQHD